MEGLYHFESDMVMPRGETSFVRPQQYPSLPR